MVMTAFSSEACEPIAVGHPQFFTRFDDQTHGTAGLVLYPDFQCNHARRPRISTDLKPAIHNGHGGKLFILPDQGCVLRQHDFTIAGEVAQFTPDQEFGPRITAKGKCQPGEKYNRPEHYWKNSASVSSSLWPRRSFANISPVLDSTR